MLILSRNEGQIINIGPDIEVTIVAVDGHKVKVGINAPREVAVDRHEIYLKKQGESK